MLRVDFSAENTSVMVGETAGEHEHTPIEKNALSEETKRTIVELSSTGLPPLRILNVLRVRVFIIHHLAVKGILEAGF